MTTKRKTHRVWPLLLAVVVIAAIATIVRAGDWHVLSPTSESDRIAKVASQELASRGLDPKLSPTTCTPHYGNDPSRANNWDCSAIDAYGDALRFTASVSGGHIHLDPIQGVTGSP